MSCVEATRISSQTRYIMLHHLTSTKKRPAIHVLFASFSHPCLHVYCTTT